jgi:glycosyltransferase involved in cell wall biosynthesis
MDRPIVKRLVIVPQGALFARDGNHYTIDAYFAQINALLPHFEEVVLCARVVDGSGGDRLLQGVEVEELSPYSGRLDLIRRVPGYRRRFREVLSGADLALMVLPGYLGAVASQTARAIGIQRVHFVVGRWGRVVISRRTGMLGRLWARSIAPLIDAIAADLTLDSLTFFNGSVPAGAPPHHHVRVSSTFAATEIRPDRADPRFDQGVRLLCVGRLSAEKGVPNLLQAVARLRDEGIRAELDVVGEGERRKELQEETRRLDLEDSVHFAGWIPRGPALWERYDRADILVLPSLEDMTPRVLLEAMARRVPVVATNVGNVPSIVRHGRTGLLVEPGSANAIVGAVRRLIDEPELRMRVVACGADLAADHTLEAETAKTVSIIRAHFACEGGRL